jgi:DNA repair exonuclease SbcCD ATPase subunit
MDFAKLNNPVIRVDWHDTSENFTPEKIKRVKQYFQDKYKTKNVVVKPVHLVNDTTNTKLKTLEVSDSILDPDYQKSIVKEYIDEMDIHVDWEAFSRLDDKVNAEMKKDDGVPHIRYNKWTLKKIEFSNFLSYGPNNELDYQRLGGITVIESNPPNFGGKTALCIDLILFLLFNTTTRSKTQEEVFNTFSDATDLNVKGYLEIDGVDYTIERKLVRKRKRNGDWDVKAELIYQRWNVATGAYENESEESRPITEKHIINAIGSKEDFLTTILTTGSNLEDLLEAKATARGQLLTRFLGLENLRKKEETCKVMYTEWAKKMVSNTHNSTQLESEIVYLENEVETSKSNITINATERQIDEKELELLNTQRDTLLMKKHQDIDRELVKLNPTLFQSEIQVAETKIHQAQQAFESIEVKEPSTYYQEKEHVAVQQQLNNLKVNFQVLSTEGTKLVKQIKEMEEGKTCPTCGTSLDTHDHSEEIKQLKQTLEAKRREVKHLQQQITEKEVELGKWIQLKQEFDNYDRNKLRKEKAHLELQQRQMELEEKNKKFQEWEKNKSKLEENLDLERQLAAIRTSIDAKIAQIELKKDALRNAERKIKDAVTLIEDKKMWIGKIKQEEKIQKIFQQYLTVYGKNGISKSIMKNMIPLINQELVRILSDTCYFSLVININEKNEVEFTMVDNESRVEKSMITGSGYEKTVASLALRAVLSKISALPKPNIIVMDEIFGKIADENLDMVGEFFNKIKNYFEHIFLITHNPLIKNWSDNVVTIRKENNISVIESVGA